MSDTMLLGVLRMPIDLTDPIAMAQLVSRARQAADRIEADAAEIERLRSDAADDAATRDMMRDILQRTAVALRGPEPPLTRWGWSDLPERAAAAGRHADELRQVVRALAQLNAWHHFGDCRAWGVGPILSPHEADELARRALQAERQSSREPGG